MLCKNDTILDFGGKMRKVRYDEYMPRDGRVPLILYPDIIRTNADADLDANWHGDIELQYVKDGSGFVLIDGKRFDVKKGDIVAIDSRAIHYLGSESLVRTSCFILGEAFCKDADIDVDVLRFEPRFQNEHLGMLLSQLERMYLEQGDICRVAKLRDIILQILIELREHHADIAVSVARSRDFERIKSAIQYIREHYHEKISLDNLSKYVLMDKYTLSKEFKRLTGQTVVEYVNRYRCKMACELIADGLSVAESADRCGFSNMSFFTRVFKKYVGCLPSKYVATAEQRKTILC